MSWDMKNGSATLARVLSFRKELDVTKIVGKLYNGTWHTQTIGEPRPVADVQIYVSSRTARDTANLAAAESALLTVSYRGDTYQGYIEDKINWADFVAGKSFTGTFRLLLVTA